jgi:hypothetical protein
MAVTRKNKKKPMTLKNQMALQALKKTVIFIACIVFVYYAFVTVAHIMSGFDSEYHKKYESVEIGCRIAFVEEVMGEPYKTSEYRLEAVAAQDFEEIKTNAYKSGAKRFCFYHNGIRIHYLLGYDEKMVLVFKAVLK